MVWIYNSPLTSSEQKLQSILKKKLNEKDVSKITVKIISLYAFLKKSNFSSPKEILESAFIDEDKKVPVFTEEQSKSIFKALKKRGGASKYPFTDHVAKKGIDLATTFVPDSVKGVVQSVNDIITYPVRVVKGNPYGDILLSAVHGATETGVTTAGDVAEGVGGPIGAALITPLTAMAAGMASLVALGEKDIGQSVAHLANAIPIIGSALGKGLTQMEHQVETLKNHPDVVGYLPVVGEYVTGQPTKPFNFESLKQQATSELTKRGLPTSTDQLKNIGMSKLAERGIPTSTDQLQARGLTELQKRIPTELKPSMVPTTVGGKRFSTRRNRYNKWLKTLRQKYVKT